MVPYKDAVMALTGGAKTRDFISAWCLMVDSSPIDDPLDEAFAAYLRSCDAGEVTREEFLAKFPELADQLKELIDAADMIGQMTMGDARQSTPQAVPGADTISKHVADGGDSGVDPAVTLPMANRDKDDPGPTLPYDLGDYELLEVLGRGGMGVVYKARQHYLDRIVAVKMIRSGMLAGEAEVRRFYTEAQAAARLNHQGIVAVHQFGQRAGHHFFSMELIDGTDLQRKINGEELEINDAVRYVRDLARAVEHAHQNDVLHRDLKPANVLIDNEDNVRVTDFGLAKNLNCDSSVTGSGAAVGTPHYMAPEQAGGQSDRATKQSDVYSLGAILFASVTGRPPIVADTVVQTLIQVVHNPAPPMRSLRYETPVDLDTIVAKCLEKQPAKRYQSAHALADDLDAFLEGRPIAARPRSVLMKAWNWFEGVPIVGALRGRRVLETTRTHMRVQATGVLMIPLLALFFAGYIVWLRHYGQAIPKAVEIGGGLEGGMYNDFSRSLADRLNESHSVITQIFPSGGSIDNRQRLLQGDIDLAPLEASSLRGGQLAVVAPLFYEAVHVLARDDSSIQSIQDLRGRRVAVGPQGSGSRATAAMLFDSMGFGKDDLQREEIDWLDLPTAESPEAAMICIGRGSQFVADLLKSKKWRLIPIEGSIDIALSHPTLMPMRIEKKHYAGCSISDTGIPTVGTTAFLAARSDAPSKLIKASLDLLYSPPQLCPGLIPPDRAAEWPGLVFHPTALDYFESLQRE